MPVIRDISVSLKPGEVWRRAGLGGRAGIKPEIKSLLQELLARVREERLLEPAIAYEISPVTSPGGGTATPDPFFCLIPPGARDVALVAGTIGPRLEGEVAAHNRRGEALRGVLLDGIGNAAVDALGQAAAKVIAKEAAARGYQAGSPFSPGMHGLPITGQRTLLERLPEAREIGVSLTPAGMLSPRKSATMIIGLGPQMTRWTRAEACARCNSSKTCPYRLPAGATEAKVSQ